MGYFTKNNVHFTLMFLLNSLIFGTKAEKYLTKKHITMKAHIVLTDIKVRSWKIKENLRNLYLMILMPSFVSHH